MTLGESVRQVAPLYNLVFVTIVIILFIIILRSRQAKQFLLPWKLLLAAVLINVVEQVLTVLKFQGFISYPIVFNSIMEMAIITLFIYILLVEKEHVKQIRTRELGQTRGTTRKKKAKKKRSKK